MDKPGPSSYGVKPPPAWPVEPWNRWLVFHDEKMERAFWLERCQTVLLYGDRLWVCQKLYQGLGSILRKGIPAWALMVMFVGNIFGPLFGAMLSIRQRDTYIWHRDAIVSAMQIGMMVSSSALGHLLDPPLKTPLAIGKRLLVSSNIATGLSGGLLLHLQWKKQIGLLVATALIGVFSAPMHCQAWFDSSDRGVFAEVIGGIDRFLLSFGLSKRVDPPPHAGEGSCMLVMSFLHVFLGLCVPLLFTFVMELSARVGYAVKKIPQRGDAPNLYVSFWVQSLVGIWAIVTCSQVIWIFAKSIATLADPEYRKFALCENY